MTTRPPDLVALQDLPVALSSLRRGDSAVVVGVRDDHLDVGDEVRSTLAQRLLELGFIPGEPLTVVGTIWPGSDPIAVRVGRSLFALRQREAAAVMVARPAGAHP